MKTINKTELQSVIKEFQQGIKIEKATARNEVRAQNYADAEHAKTISETLEYAVERLKDLLKNSQ